MIVRNTVNLLEIIIDEVALEGLDGITLEALWQRLAIRISYSLPLKKSFMEQIWKLCLEIHDFSFYELNNSRENLIIYDQYELEYLNLESDKIFEQKDIYLHCPIEDTKLGIRGSCSTYFIRNDITTIVRNLTLLEAIDRYNQKLVIVASQTLREQALIEDSVSATVQLPLSHYCLLERIGRSRNIGEITIKKSSNIKDDAKTLFYIRKGLQEYGLIRKQIYYHGNSAKNYNRQNTGTLVHLTRFFNTRKPKVIMWAEHLINYLKSKENYAAEYNEVKNELDLNYSIKKFFKIQLLQKVFRTDLKVPYRSYYPNSVEKEWQVKNNSSKERIIKLVTISDSSIKINDLWRTEEIKEDNVYSQLNLQNQKLHVSFLKQIYKIIESKEFIGASQTELTTELGFTKLIGRTLVRNLVKANVVSTYLDDIGRQRTTKFVSKKFDGKSSVKKQFELEISKIKEYSQLIKAQKIEKKLDDITEKEKKIQFNAINKINTIDVTRKKDNNDLNCQILQKASHVLWKYKLFKNQNKYKYTSSQRSNTSIKLEKSKKYLNDQMDTLNKVTEILKNDINTNFINSDFYKTLEMKLIVQKPECKKKSQKIAVVGFMKNVQNSDNNKQLSISYRLLRRANLIIECVKEHKIIEDTQKLMKYINAEEDKEGLTIKIDKNSLIRLLQKLAEDNFIKYIKLILKDKKQTKQKVVNFICDPSIDINDTVIQSAVEQAKIKFCMTETNVHESNSNFQKKSALNIITSISKEKKQMEEKVNYRNNMLGKKYGYSPKFMRMKTMHIFLYYLIYDYPEHRISKNLFRETLEKQGYDYDDLFDTDINFYSTDISWKMFVPPLPKYRGYPLGWVLMCDVLLRMPLSLFVKVHNVNFDIQGLQELLDHPIKKHFLIKDLPTSIRNMLFMKRKYIFSVHEIVTRLCYLGLVQFGPQILKDKDQVFIYLNRRTELLDTTSSAAGYHKIEDKPYPINRFIFNSFAVVENYWYEMWNTCINTCLGGRSVVEGKDILLEDLSRKVEMIQALKVKQAEDAEKHDIGFVPGDRKGAAGIDSAFFPHLKRNWNWINSSQKNIEKKEKLSNNHNEITKSTSKIKNIQIFKQTSQKRRCDPLKYQVKIFNNCIINNGNKKPKIKQHKGQLNLEFAAVSCSKPPKTIRKVLPRKSMLRKRVKYDEIDFSALQRMDKLRVDWEQHEDNILLVCKVAMVYLCPNPRRNLVTFTAIRDILRSYSFISYNKTSRACQRRLLYMLKQPKTVSSVLLGVEEVKQDYFINTHFSGLIDSVKSECENPIEYEKKVEKIFKELVTYIAKKYYNISNIERREIIALSKTIQEFNIFYRLKLPTKTIISSTVSKEVCDINDIHTSTINSVIHSSMCCGKERRSWAYQLFKVYQQYPEYLLRSAMLKIRSDQMVTMKKNYMCAYKKFGNCMPMSSSQYQLSSSYYYKFQTKWPYEVFSESYNILLSLIENYKEKDKISDGMEVKPGIGGIVVAVHDFICTDKIDIDIEIPDQIIMLDPGLPEKDEVYQRIAFRYQTILESLSTDYAEHLKNSLNNNVQSNVTSQNNIKKLSISGNQQSLDKICSTKRMNDNKNYAIQKKKQKLNNNKNVCVSQNLNKIENSKTETNNKKIQGIIRNYDKKCKYNKDIHENENQSFIKCDNVNNQSFFSTQIDLCKNKTAINIIDIKSIPECHNKNNVNTADNSNANTQNFLYKSVNIDSSIKKRQFVKAVNTVVPLKSSIVPNKIYNFQRSSRKQTDNNTPFFSCQALIKNCNDKKSHSVIKKINTNFQIIDSLKKKNYETCFQCTNKKNYLTRNKINFCRVNELIKYVYNQNAAKELAQHTDIHDVRTRQTRIAMLKMREELHDLTFHDSHHAHEYFVVNSFKLFYSLTVCPKNKNNLMMFREILVPENFLLINVDVINKVLDDMKNSAIFPKYSVSFDTFKSEIEEDGRLDWKDVYKICKFVKAKKEFGATLHNIAIYFSYLNNKLAKILLLLSEKYIILRTGIITVRYIYYQYINPWIIHSYKILRLEKEAHQTIPEGSVYILDNDESIINNYNEVKRVTTAANLFYNSSNYINLENLKHKKTMDEALNNKNKNSQINNIRKKLKNFNRNFQAKRESRDVENENSKILRRKKTVFLKQKDIYRNANLLDFNDAEKIKVVVKPWIRIDGVLNRRVLDRMLGAVLCYCIEKPGTSLTIIQNRFIPAIQPYHTRELIEILFKLNCVKMTIQRISKVTLFSKPMQFNLNGNPDLIANSDLIIIEPVLQASLNFGMFLSNKSYNLDFLSSLA